MSSATGHSRRHFLRSSAAATAATLLSARSYARVLGANERLNIGAIGLGVMGTGHLRHLVRLRDEHKQQIEVTWLCDVYRPRLGRGQSIVGEHAQTTMDYRNVLDDPNVDVVLIATPDHWHAKLAVDACLAGKDVYLEKPMVHTIEQAKELLRVKKETGRVIQVGPQSCSADLYDKIREFIKENGIGKVVLANASYCRNNRAGQWRDYGEFHPEAKPGPDLDWDTWLGHNVQICGKPLAPYRDWYRENGPGRFFQFRCYWDYSGGVATDLFFHTLAHLTKAMDLQYPERVVAAGGIWVFNRNHITPQGFPDDREVPDLFNMMIDYPGGPTVTLLGSMVNDTQIEKMIGGYEATIFIRSDTEAVVVPQKRVVDVRRDPRWKGKEELIIRGERPGTQIEHWKSLFRAIREGTEVTAPVELCYRVQIAISMGVLAYRKRCCMIWDPEREEARPAV